MTDHAPTFSQQPAGRASVSTDAAAPVTTITTHQQYITSGLERSSLLPSPIAQFNAWFQHAMHSSPRVKEPEAMTLSTVAFDPRHPERPPVPSSRVVLLKRVDPSGFVFFTNYESRKGRELFPDHAVTSDSYASLCFYWREQHRQVRVVGRVSKLPRSESKAYFDSRPVGSRVGAWASPQSAVIESGERSKLEEMVAKQERRFFPRSASVSTSDDDDGRGDRPPKGKEVDGDGEGKKTIEEEEVDVPLPDFWGGVRVEPVEVEFWMGRENRLHDRFRYTWADTDADADATANERKWKVERLAP